MPKKKSKEKLKANFFIWNFYQIVSRIYLKLKYHIKYNRKAFTSRNKKEGCIVLYNHSCNSDHFILTGMFRSTRVRYVITRRFYYNLGVRKAVTLARGIFRDQFKNDTASIIKIKRTCEKGGIVSLAPAGQITIDGRMPYINPIIVKLLKMCKVDVYTVQISGSYLASPKWAKEKRSYPISVKCVKTLTKEELAYNDIDYCYNRIVKDLNISDLDYQNQVMKKIKGKNLSKGIEDVFYICPCCGKKYTLKTEDSKIICTACSNTVLYNEYGKLEGVGSNYVLMKDESVWYDYQKHLIMKQILNNNYSLTSIVDLYTVQGKKETIELAGHGTLTFNIDSLYYDGTYLNEVIHKDFNINTIYQLPFAPGERFNIPDDEEFYEFVPKNKRTVTEWVQAIDALNELKVKGELNANNNNESTKL